MNRLYSSLTIPRNLRLHKFSTHRRNVKEGPGLSEFIVKSTSGSKEKISLDKNGIIVSETPLKYFIETYGCQMNVSDSEIVTTLLQSSGHKPAQNLEEASLILTNTCSVRDNAEQKVWQRLKFFQSMRKKNKVKGQSQQFPLVGVLGCMAERLKEKLLIEESVDFVCGPDAYRDIPRLLQGILSAGQKQANVMLSLEETYADIHPIREVNSSSAFVSIMRGCNNMCSYCIVPFTRGRERSRPMHSILQEIQGLSDKGIKEIVLLGQNVNGYHDTSEESAKLFPESTYKSTPGFGNLYQSKKRDLPGARFPDLLKAVAEINPEIRIRFTSPHPKDFPEEVLHVIAQTPNLCASLHLPFQSGSNTVLDRMRREYTREAYLELIKRCREIIPQVNISCDVIAGFCEETEEEHQDTLALMKEVQFDQAFMFAYSLREKTHAARSMNDNVPEDIKQRRLREIIDCFRENIVAKNMKEEYGALRLVLIEGESTKSTPENLSYTGRTDGNKRIIFPATDTFHFTRDNFFPNKDESPISNSQDISLYDLFHRPINQWKDEELSQLLSKGWTPSNTLETSSLPPLIKHDNLIGKYGIVRVLHANSSTLRGVLIGHCSLMDFQHISNLSHK